MLMTTALLSLFAACTNDDFISNEQGIQNGDAAFRPQVDVTLNVVNEGNADTRLIFDTDDRKYAWENGDVIGALLMDEMRDGREDGERPYVDLEEWEARPWTERYRLVDYVSTDYPFIRQENGQWTTNAKMLEGNYFFTYPFASYMGNREAVHSIGEQVQEGEDWAKAYAENNFFVGYSRIYAGTEGDEVMSANLEMTPVLGAIGVTVTNADDKPFKVEKIVLESSQLSTLIKINPAYAEYKGEDPSIDVKSPYYNIDLTKAQWWKKTPYNGFFNYANYEGNFEEVYGDANSTWVNNTAESANYNRKNALRAVINNVAESGHRAELTITDSPELGADESADFVIMINDYYYDDEVEKTDQDYDRDGMKDGALKAYIYTNIGMAGPVVISNLKKEVQGDGVTAITNKAITEVNPNEKNNVTLQIMSNSIQGATKMNVYNESDLEQLIEWNKGQQRVYIADLKQDVILTKSMSDMLMAQEWGLTNMLVNTDKFKLTLAEGVSKNILDKVLVNGNIEVEGELELGTNSYVSGKYNTQNATDDGKRVQEIENELTIAEGAKVTVASAIQRQTTGKNQNQSLTVAENEGTFIVNAEIGALSFTNKNEMEVNAVVSLNEASKNEGTLTIGTNGNVRGTSSNYLSNEGVQHGTIEEGIVYAVINNNGQISSLNNNELGKVIVGKDAETNVITNDGIVDISADITLKVQIGTNSGELAYTVAKGTPVTMKAVADAGITQLTVDGGSVTSATDAEVADAASVTKVIFTENGGNVGGEKPSAFSAASVEVNGVVALQNVTFGGSEIEIKKGSVDIQGVVKAENATVKLGSYDYRKYQAFGAELTVGLGDELYAKYIDKAVKDNYGKYITKDMVKVDNRGKVVLSNTAIDETKDTGISWTGTDPEATKEYVTTINNADDFAKLDPAATDYIINAEITLDATMAGKLVDKNITLTSTAQLKGLTPTLVNGQPLTLKKLIVEGGSSVICEIAGNKNVILKVDMIDATSASEDSKFSGTNGFLEIDEVASENFTSSNIINYAGIKIVTVAKDKDGNWLQYYETGWGEYKGTLM